MVPSSAIIKRNRADLLHNNSPFYMLLISTDKINTVLEYVIAIIQKVHPPNVSKNTVITPMRHTNLERCHVLLETTRLAVQYYFTMISA